MELTPRQEAILGLIIREYVDIAQPIGSKVIVERYNLDVSSATVRNEMGALTAAGLLRQPHTSAGRVPTEEGYRYFVQRLEKDPDLPLDERRTISHQFYQAHTDVDHWMRLAAAVLARHARGASLVTAPHPDLTRFKQLELIMTQGRLVLMVLVLEGGEVRQQMLTLAEPVQSDTLRESAARITELCQGKTAESVASLGGQLPSLEQDVLRLVAEVMQRGDVLASGQIYRDGLSNVLAEPEFAESESARQALRVLDEPQFLEAFLAKALSPTIGGVQVVIGGEGGWEELKDCSMVLARYGSSELATGALAVIGPVRMPYGRTISAVRFVTGLMTDLVIDMYSG